MGTVAEVYPNFDVSIVGPLSASSTLTKQPGSISGTGTDVLRLTTVGGSLTDKGLLFRVRGFTTENITHSIYQRWNNTSGTENQHCELWARIKSLSPLTCYKMRRTATSLQVVRVVNGASSTIGSIAINGDGDSINPWLYQMTLSGSSIDCTVIRTDNNATTNLSVADAVIEGSGQWGFFMNVRDNNANYVEVDDYRFEETF